MFKEKDFVDVIEFALGVYENIRYRHPQRYEALKSDSKVVIHKAEHDQEIANPFPIIMDTLMQYNQKHLNSEEAMVSISDAFQIPDTPPLSLAERIVWILTGLQPAQFNVNAREYNYPVFEEEERIPSWLWLMLVTVLAVLGIIIGL